MTAIRAALPTQRIGTSRAMTPVDARDEWPAVQRADVGAGASLLIPTPLHDQSKEPSRSAPTIPHTPSLPSDALASTTSATGTSSGHGFPLFLALAVAGWALVLVGRRAMPSLLTLRQRSDRPLVSPG